MNRLLRLSYALLLLISTEGYSTWAHLELGAGNYGPDGHTKTSQGKTVLMEIEEVSEKKNYIDELEEVGRGDYNPEEQYGVLFWTLDELVSRYGDDGIFHVNDLYEEYAVFAAQKLSEYARGKGYDSIVIEAISGDYQLIDSKQTLSSFGKDKYSTAHLKNPEVSLYNVRMDGEHLYSTDHSREKARLMLRNLANLSESGLYLFILYHENFIPLEEQAEFIEKNIFYHATEEWDPVPYIYPEGGVIDKEWGRVFHIPSREPISLLPEAAAMAVEDDYVFYLIQENIDNLDIANTSDSAAKELISLIEEGYMIDALNMAKLISLLDHANPKNNATKVILKAIENRTPINADHLSSLITLLDYANPSDCAAKILMKAIEYNAPINSNHLGALINLLTHANPSNNATAVLLKAIECGIKFGPKERMLLAEASKTANALKNVDKIRNALHERELKNQI